eukprot:TRINITY_DN2908_c0_g1_i2.p1 TRINITY_DN2908_c0_g1~~TRINITY_DN2908_c0_g1_i2.p1  ORF type:complete len:188 (-),score=46.83 TRINITY_DN2908_c0_g1_i2:41-604(-)
MIEEKKKKDVAEEQEKILYEKLLEDTIQSKNIVVGKNLFNAIPEYLKIAEIYVDQNSKLHFPALFIYEEYHQLDLIQDFQEDVTFGDHLRQMFPGNEFPDWDIGNQYQYKNLQIFTIVNHTEPLTGNQNRKRARKVRIRKKTTLLQVLNHPEYVMPGMPVFYVVPKKSVAKMRFLSSKISELGKSME